MSLASLLLGYSECRWEGMEEGLLLSVNFLGGMCCFPSHTLACLWALPDKAWEGRSDRLVIPAARSSRLPPPPLTPTPHPRPVVCMFGRKLCLPIWLQAIGYKNWQMRAKKLDSDSPNWLLCENLSLSKNADCFVLVIYLKRGEKIWQHHFNVSTRFFFFFFFFQFTDLSYLFG